MINILLYSRLKNEFDCFLQFKSLCGKNKYFYTSVLAYGTKRFLSCDDLFTVVGAGGGMSSVGM